ncbi:Abhydrolase domain-containing protein [Ceratobasidium sp. AG-Ba]|nr:Abhydrolase domain-containing protein [Ceratobasidium sp. AG-Ba]
MTTKSSDPALTLRGDSNPPLSQTSRKKQWATTSALVLSGHLLARFDTWSIPTLPRSSSLPPAKPRSRPVGDVEWHRCDGISDPRIECGSIVAPLDYFDPSAGITTIALAKYKADPLLRRGSVFVNPGGPGGPGTQLATQSGPGLSATRIGPYYDIVGFDPRGIGATTPTVKCFESRASNDEFYRNTVFELGYTQPPNTTISAKHSSDALLAQQRAFYDIVSQQRQALALFETQAKLCAKNMPNGGSDLKYMGTPSVVRDIAFMTDVLDGPGAKINYWGGSYGSILGVFLFNMMPERIGRGVIEAVVNPALWVDQYSHEWMDNWVQDADEAYHWFLDSCAKVGESQCALARENASAKTIEDRIERFMNDLYDSPMPSVNSIVPAFLTSGAVRSRLYDAMEAPFSWPEFAVLLDKAMNGDPAPFMNPILPDLTRDRFDHAELARYAVTCSDSRPFNKSDPASFPTPESLARGIVARVNNTSRYFGASPGLTDIDGGCQFWPVEGIERYTGPWNKTLANPILVISSTVDPITPLASAKFVNDQLGNSSRLVTVTAPGHGVQFPSSCQYKASLDYFNHGILPEDGLNCKTERGPFGISESSFATMSSEDKKLVETGEDFIRILGEIRRGRV